MICMKDNPIVKAEMLIRRHVEEVFNAFIDPKITTKFWFSKSSGRLEKGKTIHWDWEIYGVGDDIYVIDILENKRIKIQSSDGTTIEWIFDSRSTGHTFVSIINEGFCGTGDSIVNQAIDSMGGYTMVLCNLKALLEYNINLNLIADKAPDAHI